MAELKKNLTTAPTAAHEWTVNDMRLIDADVLLKELNDLEPRCANKYVKQGLDDALHYYMPQILEEQPTLDAVPVVRCKDCLYWQSGENECEKWEYCTLHNTGIGPHSFCSYGERKEAEGDG